MSLPSPEAGQGGHFVPVLAPPDWSEAMRHAVRAQRCGQMAQALVGYREALEVARQALQSTCGAQAESRLPAFVSSALCLAAIWHSHDTHEALLQHLQAHGVDPQMERALRSGGVSLNSASVAHH